MKFAQVYPHASEDPAHAGFDRWCKLRNEADVPDDHLFLGVTDEAVWMFARMIGFPDRFCRKAYFESQESDVKRFDWITPSFGEGLTGYDFAHCIRHWHKLNEQHEFSSAEYLRKEGYEGVGHPLIFLSHVQSEPLASTLRVTETRLWKDTAATHSPLYFWLDYLILRQCNNDFKCEYIVAVIQAISWTICIEDEKETYFDRLFCVFEVSSSTTFAGPGTENSQLDIVFSEKHAKTMDGQMRRHGLLLLIATPAYVVMGVVFVVLGIQLSSAFYVVFGIATALVAPNVFACSLIEAYFGKPEHLLKHIQTIRRVTRCGPLEAISKRLRKVSPLNSLRWLDTENSKCRDDDSVKKIQAFVEQRGGFDMLDCTIALSARFAASRRRRQKYLSHGGRAVLDMWLYRIKWSTFMLFFFLAVVAFVLGMVFPSSFPFTL
eukprot:TRINITY_DN20951_c0_g1_i1.p1 TRINITY_DN20951_c0_g1~~TRINITY_DN20951_c0_g1_i1.p1  ORF type:complete len:434 (+),score=36.53 TRINITY_DN20951_c0_g1_i1:86-1387(+)